MADKARRPDWSHWRYIPSATIQECVALSLGIDPDKLRFRDRAGAMGMIVDLDESPEFKKRLRLAIANVKKLSADADEFREVTTFNISLPQFAAAALEWEWKIPTEMKALAEPQKQDVEIRILRQQVETLTQERDLWKHKADEAQKQLAAGHEHYSTKLSVLIQAATRFWERALKKEPDTWTENSVVVAFLMEKNFAEVLAKKGATIIRPEWVPTGRKPKNR